MQFFTKNTFFFIIAFAAIATAKVNGSVKTSQTSKVDEICDGINLGIFVNPNGCTSYILCIFGEPNVSFCDFSTPVFDPERLICVAGKV
jgi:Chitin binding Peritrophin-A domain